MARKTLLFALLFCLANIGFAMDLPVGPDPESELLAQGWQRIGEHVLQRSLGGNETETLAFGQKGFEWMLQTSKDRFGFLLGEYEKYPSDTLEKTILSLRDEIAAMEKKLAAGLEEAGKGTAMLGCDISFGAHANAYPLNPGPGVGAAADAYFRNNCYYWGKAEASVYVRATQGGVTTGDSAGQTQEGENVQASVSRTRSGGEDCYSSAWARASSDGLGIYYETSAANDECPIPTTPPSITIYGPSWVFVNGYNCESASWQAVVSDGTPPYGAVQWYWNGYFVGSGDFYEGFFCGYNWNGQEYLTLTATVTDSAGRSASTNHYVTIYYTSSGCNPLMERICPIDPILQ